MAAQSIHPRYNYCFTYNNYTEDGEVSLQLWLTNNCKYAVYGHEVAPSTGTKHLQGFFSLKKKMRITTIQSQFTERLINLALITARGNGSQNRIYCTKADPNSFWEHGDASSTGAGARTDLMEITSKIKQGQSLVSIAFEHPVEWVRHSRGFKDLSGMLKKRMAEDFRDLTVSVFVGTGGVGKTFRAIDESQRLGFGYPYIVNIPADKNGAVWWDMYDGEKSILIDDFYGWIQPHSLYRLLDKYKLQCPYKGGLLWAEWTHVWITSNKPPEDWYKKETYDRLDKDAFNR